MQVRRTRLAISVAAMAMAAFDATASTLPSVQPSGSSVPANLLRISLVFPRPIGRSLLPEITLSHADGRAIDQPFLPQELWSPDGRVLTLLMHPGRVKSGLVAHEQLGSIVAPGDDIGLALRGRRLKAWHVIEDDAEGPRVSNWHLSHVEAGSRRPLVVTLDAPIDGRDADHIAVAGPDGSRLAGTASLGLAEATWVFTPRAAWRAGDYRLVVRGTIEDASGNRPDDPFEAEGLSKPRVEPTDLFITYQVNASNGQP